jgi:hypothetical protein
VPALFLGRRRERERAVWLDQGVLSLIAHIKIVMSWFQIIAFGVAAVPVGVLWVMML